MHQNQQETLYGDILDPLTRYLKATDSDYGVLLTAPWGTGKTYFVQNVLKPAIADAGYKTSGWIYVSLNGLSDTSAIARGVLVRSLLSETQRDRIGGIIDTLLDTASGWEKPRSVISAVTSLLTLDKADSRWRLKAGKLDLSRLVLVIDDLERISPSLPIEEVLGSIYDAFISKGVKTVVICAANEIADERKKEALERSAEKVFRWTIEFAPDENLLVRHIIDERFGTCEGYQQLAASLPRFVEALRTLGMRVNLRTVVFLSDVFLEIYPIAAQITDSDDEAMKAIFDSTAVFAQEFKLGNIRANTNLQDATFLFHYLEDTASAEQKDSIANRIRDLYIGRAGLTFRPLTAVQSLITNGKLQRDEMEREFRREFTDDRPAHEIVRDRLFRFRELDEDTYWKTLSEVGDYLTTGHFRLTDIFHMYHALAFLVERGYPTSFASVEKVRELARRPVTASSKHPENLPDETQLEIFLNSFSNELLNGDPFLQELRDEIVMRAGQKESHRLEELVDRLFDSIKRGDRQFGSVVGEIDNRRLFQTIVRSERHHRFGELGPSGIQRFESCIQSNILAESALPAKDLNHELEPLRITISELSKQIESLRSQPFLLRRFQDLLNIMREAEEKLSET